MLKKRPIKLGLNMFLALFLTVALAACGGGSSDTSTEGEAIGTPEAAETAEAAPEATEEAAESEVISETDGMSETGETTAEVASLITVESETFVGDIIGDNNPALVTLSTDGSMLVWPEVEGHFWNKKEGLCTYLFDTAAKGCVDAPDTFEGYPYAFFWSPDSTTIALTEDPITLGNESDIWTYDVVAGTINNLTNDNIEGSWVSQTGYELDYLPMWSPEGDSIYFWRSVPIQAPISFTLQLMSIAPTGGEPELVRDYTEDLIGQLLYFNVEYWVMDGISAISPDGTKIAMIMTDVENPESVDTNGVWIIDLNDPTAPPTQIAPQSALQVAQPAWSAENFPLVPVGLSWQADSSSIVVMTYNVDEQVPLVVLYDIDVATGELTPIVDFSSVADESTYMTEPVTVNGQEGPPLRAFSPWAAVMTPNNENVLMYQNIGDFAGLFVSDLPPSTDLPGVAYVSNILEGVSTTRSSRGTDGKVLISNILFATSPTE